MGVQKHNNDKRSAKKIVSKSFFKKIRRKIQNNFFFLILYHVFGRFSVRGVQKHDKKYHTQNLTPSLFHTLTHPPTTGATDFSFLPAPCVGLPGTATGNATVVLSHWQ
jgi:hypothetical protein